MFSNIGMPELLVILLIIMVLFGASRIPDIAKGLRKGIDEFKNPSDDNDTKEPPAADTATNDQKSESKEQAKTEG